MEVPRFIRIESTTKLEDIPQLDDFNNSNAIDIEDKTLEEIKEIVKNYGKAVKYFSWKLGNEVTKSSDVIEVLNLMPMLEEILVDSYEDFADEESSIELKLPHLKSLFIMSRRAFAFFYNYLPPDCLEKLHIANIGFIEPELFPQFLSKQKSIKIFQLYSPFPLKDLNSLSLDELSLGGIYFPTKVIDLLQIQTELKKFKLSPQEINVGLLEEVCKLSKLEVLSIVSTRIKDGHMLEKLKNLKHLKLGKLREENLQTFFNFKLDSLERLKILSSLINIPEILEMISMSFPNLKILELKSSQKLNYFAKIFPNLEELILDFEKNLCELDTGIVNRNLKKLTLNHDRKSPFEFHERLEYFFEVFEIFPNLETMELLVHLSYKDTSKHLKKKIFDEKILKIQNLKSRLMLEEFDKKDLTKDEEEILKYAQKIKNVKLTINEQINQFS